MEEVAVVKMNRTEQDLDETASTDDELLSSSIEEAEEAAEWLVDVGLGDILDGLMESSRQVGGSDKLWSSLTDHSQRFSRHQIETVKRRVETVRASLKPARHQRPDCRNIFRDADQNSDGSSGSRSSSATPECPDLLDSRLSKTSLENLSHATLWTTSASSDNRIENMGSRNQLDQILPQSLSKISALPSDMPPTGHSIEMRRARRRNLKYLKEQFPANNVVIKPKRSNLFGMHSRDHVAGHERELGVEIVKYKSTETLSASTGIDRLSFYFSHFSQLNQVQPPTKVRNRRYEELDAAQRKKMRQLSLLELTVLFDQHRLDAGRKRRIPRKVKVHHNSDGALYGVQLSQLVDKDRRIKAATKTPFVMDTLIDLLTRDHLDEGGLLRIPGSQQKMASLQKLMDSRWKIGLVDTKDVAALRAALLDEVSCHDLAGLLKHFLRQLPESLFTVALVDLFAQVADIGGIEEQLRALSLLVLQLPEANYHTLRSLLRFLKDVVEHQSTNRMTASNVATVMGPNLFPLPPVAAKTNSKTAAKTLTQGVAYTAKANRVLELLLIHQEHIFVIPAPMQQHLLHMEFS